MRDERQLSDFGMRISDFVLVEEQIRNPKSKIQNPSLIPHPFLQRHPHSTLPLSIIDPILLNQIVALAKFYIGASPIRSRVR